LRKEALLVEFQETHIEVLHSQILFFIRKDYHVHLWINSAVEFKDVYSGKVSIIREDTKISSLNISLLYKIIRYVQRHKINKIVLNTAHGLLARNLCLLLLQSRVEVIGVLHQAHKLLKSSTQKIISKKIKKYFVLNDYVKNFIDEETNNSYNINVFYPIFFPYENNKGNKSDKIVITVPGRIIQIRKDYVFLLNNILKLSDELKQKFQFIFLGSASKSESSEVLELIYENNIDKDFVKIFKKHITENEYNEMLKKSDYIMPLIHPSSHSYNEYMSTEISGAFNTAFGFKKPLLMYESFREFEDFKHFSLFYNERNFIQLLEKITKEDLTKVIKTNYGNYKKFDLNYQTEKYIKFIES
jgi:hypothetical protein